MTTIMVATRRSPTPDNTEQHDNNDKNEEMDYPLTIMTTTTMATTRMEKKEILYSSRVPALRRILTCCLSYCSADVLFVVLFCRRVVCRIVLQTCCLSYCSADVLAVVLFCRRVVCRIVLQTCCLSYCSSANTLNVHSTVLTHLSPVVSAYCLTRLQLPGTNFLFLSVLLRLCQFFPIFIQHLCFVF